MTQQDGALLRGTPAFNPGAAKFGTNGLAGGSVFQFPSFADAHLSLTGAPGGGIGVPSAAFGSGGLTSGVLSFPASVASGASSTGADGGNIGPGTSPAETHDVKVKTTAKSRRVIAGRQNWWWFGQDDDGYVMLRIGDPVGGVEATFKATTLPINDGNQHHVELVFRGSNNNTRIYVDGTQVLSTGATVKTAGTTTQYPFTIGGLGSVTAVDWAGDGGGTIDEYRISNVARNTATFTPPTSAYTADANTNLLMHFDGDTLDSSGNNVTATLIRSGSAVGGNGAGTIEGFVDTTSTGGNRVWCGHDAWYWIGVDSTGKPTARYGTASVGGEVTLTGATAINDGTKHHMALVLGDGSTNRLYCDGSLVASSGVPAIAGGIASTARMCIGGFSSSSAADWVGGIDEVRVSKVARYTGSTYTVPTAAFTTDANTVVLAHLEADGSDSSGNNFGVRILPTDANLIFSPANWKVRAAAGGVPAYAKTINSGAYVRCQIGGSPSSITLEFDVSAVVAPNPMIAYSIDGKGFVRVPLAASIVVPIPSDNTWSTHTLTVMMDASTESVSVNRWSPQATAVVLNAISCGGATVATKTITRRALTVWVFGDSITEGIRTLSAAAVDVNGNSAQLGWAYSLGAALGAEVGVIGFGRQGAEKAATNSGNVPAGKTTWNLLWDSEPRDFTAVPDLVLIAWSENDGGNGISTADYKSAMLLAVNGLLGATPTKTRIGLLTNFRGTYYPGAQADIAASCSQPGRVRVIDTTNWITAADTTDGVHPTGYTGSKVGGLLAAASRDVLRKGMFVKKAGALLPVTLDRI